MRSETSVGLTAALLLSTAVARADVEISAKPTSNMSCDAGVCTATAQKAVLNVSDLATMLASGDVAVKTGSIARDIEIDQPLTWSNTSRLTLDAQASVTVKKQITAAGQGALTVITNDTGGANAKNKTGEFIIVPERGSVQFWDLGSSLIIDGNSYTLVGDIKTLASDIAANPSGFYALAKPYDASGDGVYIGSAIPTELDGVFEGLGNAISNFTVGLEGNSTQLFGFYSDVSFTAAVRHFGLLSMTTDSVGIPVSSAVGGLAAGNGGLIDSSWVTGKFSVPRGASSVGGLAGVSIGEIERSYVKVDILTDESTAAYIGGLAGENYDGTITESFSAGSVAATHGSELTVGGLVGFNAGAIDNSYSVSLVREGGGNGGSLIFGGFTGQNDSNGTITSSYAAGKIVTRDREATDLGGLIGFDASAPGSLADTYWNVDKGVSDPSQGAGNVKDDPGITGLTTQQLQSGLPDGFDPKIWGSDPNINNGYPYLLANPPR
ncbi:MAG TPA: hypothetical protein VHU18_10750 [Rhizomicrobium sp.]|nr:hypothetical protein [Rhizomicrobium sp.]